MRAGNTIDGNALEAMVARSAGNLQQQKVIVLEFGIRSVELRKELAKQSLKVKVRANGVTLIKTAARSAVVDNNCIASVVFNTLGSTIFEGGDKVIFELCESCRLSSSRTLATCELPLASVFSVTDFDHSSSLRLGSFSKTDTSRIYNEKLLGKSSQAYNLQFKSLDRPAKVLADLQLEIDVRLPTLQAAGGIWKLRSVEMPQMPELCRNRSAHTTEVAKKECLEFVDKAEKALECLRRVLAESRRGALCDDVSTYCGSVYSETTTIPPLLETTFPPLSEFEVDV